MVCSFLTVHLICGKFVPLYSEPCSSEVVGGWLVPFGPFLQFYGCSRTPLGPLGHSLDHSWCWTFIWYLLLHIPLLSTAPVICTLFSWPLSTQTCPRTIPPLTHTKIHKFSQVPLRTSQIISPLCQTTPNNACKLLHWWFTLSKISYALRFKLSWLGIQYHCQTVL